MYNSPIGPEQSVDRVFLDALCTDCVCPVAPVPPTLPAAPVAPAIVT